MKVSKIAGVSILALGLVLGMALPVLASGLALPEASNILPEVLKRNPFVFSLASRSLSYQ